MNCNSELIQNKIAQATHAWLFLDYDGTLADFAPTPDHVHPDPELIDLLDLLSRDPHLRISLVSGRRLDHVRKLIPLPGIFLAGTYGVELQTPNGKQIYRLPFQSIRPTLETLKPHWERLITGREGFYLEDKGWSLAIHARFARQMESDAILSAARQTAEEAAEKGDFCLFGGHRFLEVAPCIANKKEAVKYMWERFPLPGVMYIYIGDDDKDEDAFGVIQDNGGLAILVAYESRDSRADCRLESPERVRQWLRGLPELLGMRI